MTTQLFRNIHYQEFFYTGRQTQLKLKTTIFKEVVDKSIHDAISSHNEAFVNIFHNAMREAIHGFLVGQGGPACYNILDPSS